MDWRYYKYMIQCVGDPRNNVEISREEQRALFDQHKNAILLRYTTCFDCAQDQNWFFCLKDTPYDFESLKSKRKNVVRKGINNFTVREIKASDYVQELCELTNDAYQGYENPNKVTYAQTEKKARGIDAREDYFVLGAFCNEDQKLAGYVWCHVNGKWITMSEQKALRSYESKGVNAALCHGLCTLYNEQFSDCILCDGERNVLHKTAFQDYLIKYFGFRYAYCKLHIVFNPRFDLLIRAALFLLPVYGWLLKRAKPKLYARIAAIKMLKDISGR